jgi:hypothetical protein
MTEKTHDAFALVRRIVANEAAGLSPQDATELALAGKVRVRARGVEQGEA